MKIRCPDAVKICSATLYNYRLVFRGPADLEQENGFKTVGGLWEISSDDEENLDSYEGYPYCYRKEMVEVVKENGEKIKAMIYLMNDGGYAYPNDYYLNVVVKGFQDFQLPVHYIHKALLDKRLPWRG